MGFHKRRRNRGGGGGGGHHGHGGGHHGHGGHGFWTGEANGLQPGDDIGNRKNLKALVMPPDDLGNRRDPEEDEFIPADDLGNRVDANPTHELSGVLLDLDPRKRRRRPKGAAPLERIGRFVIPLIAGGNRPPAPGFQPAFADESEADDSDSFGEPRAPQQRPKQRQQQQQQQQKKKFEHVDGIAAQEVSERRAARFFDFDEDDRFEYTLRSPAEDKRALAERFVADILREAGRDATVAARILQDGDKPKLVVTIDDRGPSATLPPERRGPASDGPLFVLGNGALLSLNYLVNKVVNRYPDDRIRLAVLPLLDEPLYLVSLEQHRRRAAPVTAPVVLTSAAAPTTAPAIAPVVVAPAATSVAPESASSIAELVVPAPPPTVLPSAAPAADDEGPARKPRRGRKKVADADVVDEAPVAPAAPAIAAVPESSLPPPVAAPAPAAVAAPAAAPAAIAATPSSEPELESPSKARRRVPPLDDFPVRPPRGDGPPLRGKVRRASTALVEVVRVPKKQ